MLLILASVGMLSCRFKKEKKLNRYVSLWRKDKIPYGTYYAYESLGYIFPDSKISINESSPVKFMYNTGNDDTDSNSTKQTQAYIVISPRVIPDPAEINALMNYVGQGNTVFISSFYFGDSLLNYLKIKAGSDFDDYYKGDTFRVNVLNPLSNESLYFEYPGDSYSNHFRSLDSQYVSILGTDGKGRPDFVRYNYKGGGALYLHFAPMAFTNFFLLHKNNKAYYDNALSYLPKSVSEVKWDDYFRYSKDFSVFSFLLSIPAFKWAFGLLLLLFLLIYLFESKRRQRMIPGVTTLRNSSLDFVKTIGRLYYQRKDNLNLANKMSAHFLGRVRTKYNLPTSMLNAEFAEKLSYKSGYQKELVQDIVNSLNDIQLNQSMSDENLLQLNEKLEAFYKHT